VSVSLVSSIVSVIVGLKNVSASESLVFYEMSLGGKYINAGVPKASLVFTRFVFCNQ